MEDFYIEKIEIVFDKFYDLFEDALKKRNSNSSNDFVQTAEMVKNYYPKISNKIDRVVFYYLECENSDEKLDYLISLYKGIKEKIYE